MKSIAELLAGKIPAHLVAACTPAAIYSARGIAVGHWTCPACDRVFVAEDYPSNQCPGCGRPLPDRCASTTDEGVSTCAGIVEPTSETVSGQVVWSMPSPVCPKCVHGDLQVSREALVRSQVPLETMPNVGRNYQRVPHRSGADSVVHEWINNLAAGCVAESLYIWGTVGSGKTTLAGFAAARGIMAGHFESFLWCREYDLITAAKGMYGSDPGCMELLGRAKAVDLLVIDEAMSTRGESLTQHSRDQIGEILARRFGGKSTIMTSNEPLGPDGAQWVKWFGDRRIASRWDGSGTVVECSGPDMRKGAA
jgi:hypothetical protein